MIYIEQNAVNNIFVNVSQYKTGNYGANPKYLWRLQNAQGRNIVSFYPENSTSTYPSAYTGRYDVFTFNTFKNLPENYIYSAGTDCNLHLVNENQYWLGIYEMPPNSTSLNPSGEKLLNSLSFIFVPVENEFYTGNTANFEPNKIYYKNGDGITPTPSNTVSPTPTPTITPTNTGTATPTPTPTNTNIPSITPTNTPYFVCPQQMNITGFTGSYSGYNGTYNRITYQSNGNTFEGGQTITGTGWDTNQLFGLYLTAWENSNGIQLVYRNNSQYVFTAIDAINNGVVNAPDYIELPTFTYYAPDIYAYPAEQGQTIFVFGGSPLVSFNITFTYPTNCPTPTQTPTNTATPSPTPSITPTNTNTPSITPSITPSATPLPLFVAGGSSNNKLGYSTDGLTWSASTNGNSVFNDIQGLTYDGSKFWAVGASAVSSGNTIGYSTDGLIWSAATNSGAPLSLSTQDIIWNGSKYVAATTYFSSINNPVLIYSTDGLTWSASTNGNTIFSALTFSLAWNGTIFVAGGLGTNTLGYSTDGITWSASTNGNSIITNRCLSLAWNGTIFVAGGLGTNRLGYSTDGLTWSASTNGNSIFGTLVNAFAWNGTIFVGGGSGTNVLGYSTDGITWSASTNGNTIFPSGGLNPPVVNSVIWNGNKFVAVGSYEPTFFNQDPIIAYSNDGITWSAATNTIAAFGANAGMNAVASKPSPNLYPPR